MKGGPQQKRPPSRFQNGVSSSPVSSAAAVYLLLGLFGAVERQDRGGVDLAGPTLGVGAIGLKLAVPQFALGFDEGTLLKGSGPFSKLPSDHDPMPLSSFCWGDRERAGPAPKGKGRFVGGDLQGEPTKQSHAVPQGAGL